MKQTGAALAFEAYKALILARCRATRTGKPEEILVGRYSLGTIDKNGKINIQLRGRNCDENV